MDFVDEISEWSIKVVFFDVEFCFENRIECKSVENLMRFGVEEYLNLWLEVEESEEGDVVDVFFVFG